ncbi:MAG: thymidine phosphorylase [Gracilibacter sp. BRH_c7a]|nr:MAG: thymidine phosphorylase [Gracilibacter sp. BRH_c7a]
MNMVRIIEKKRDGHVITKEEIQSLIKGYVDGSIPDYQISAWAMAVYFNGMTAEETSNLTLAMAESGSKLDLSSLGKVFVDKHSSGGVGDKTTLIIAPLVAACGVPVAKMSGRGLGHTGGTIDKLLAIPGFRVEMKEEEFLKQIQKIGISVISQTGNMVPADKKLYALRDVTATVDSIPLIASSIMSKKIAAGAQAIVLDVKYGSGAFMSSLEDAKELANTMVAIGKSLNRETVAILSKMDQPLGRAIGNSLEVLEAIEILKGSGPQDLLEVCLELASWMLVLGKKAEDTQDARGILEESLQSGSAWEKFLDFVAAQGGDRESVIKSQLYLSPIQTVYQAEKAGIIQNIDAKKIGLAAMTLGAGRETKESEIDYGAGVYLLKKTGDFVQAGEPIMKLYSSSEDKIMAAKVMIADGITIGDHEVSSSEIVSTVVK